MVKERLWLHVMGCREFESHIQTTIYFLILYMVHIIYTLRSGQFWSSPKILLRCFFTVILPAGQTRGYDGDSCTTCGHTEIACSRIRRCRTG